MQPKREIIEVRDQAGRQSIIIRVTPYERSQSLDGLGEWMAGLSSAFTEDGERVNQLQDGSFETVEIPPRRFWRVA